VRLEWDKDEAGAGASLRLDRYVIAIQHRGVALEDLVVGQTLAGLVEWNTCVATSALV